MRLFLAALGSASLVVVAACTGGTAPGTSIHGGPDEIAPPNSVDSPGGGPDSPGKSNQDSPGSTPQDSSGSCFDCSGTYQCSAPASSGSSSQPSYVTLTPAADGCNLTSSNASSKSTAEIQCGGQFVETDNNVTTSGTWTGGPGRFTVTFVVNTQQVDVSCVLTSVVPTPTPVDADAG